MENQYKPQDNNSRGINANPPQNNPPSNPLPHKSNTWIYGVVIALLLGACIYLFVTRNKETEQKQIALQQRDTVFVEKENLQEQFNAASARLDAMVSTNEQLKDEVAQKDGSIGKLRKEFQSLMAKENKTQADYDRAKTLITQLNSKIASYEVRIAELEDDNQRLSSKVSVTLKERDSTVTENIALKKIGSVLHVNNIQMIPIQLRRGGTKERETGKAKKADLIRIIFDIDENRIVESGTRQLYLRITAPDGNLLSNAAYGSGVTTNAEGEQMGYTLNKGVELIQNQPLKNVIINWNQDSDYKKGNYKIQVYSEGYEVGNGIVHLR